MSSPIHLEWRHDVAVIYCPERIIADEIQELRTSAVGAIEKTGRVICQLERVKFIDSVGLGLLASLCLSARKRAGDVKLVAPSGGVKEILEITLLGRVFAVHPTVEAAVAAFSTAALASR